MIEASQAEGQIIESQLPINRKPIFRRVLIANKTNKECMTNENDPCLNSLDATKRTVFDHVKHTCKVRMDKNSGVNLTTMKSDEWVEEKTPECPEETHTNSITNVLKPLQVKCSTNTGSSSFNDFPILVENSEPSVVEHEEVDPDTHTSISNIDVMSDSSAGPPDKLTPPQMEMTLQTLNSQLSKDHSKQEVTKTYSNDVLLNELPAKIKDCLAVEEPPNIESISDIESSSDMKDLEDLEREFVKNDSITLRLEENSFPMYVDKYETSKEGVNDKHQLSKEAVTYFGEEGHFDQTSALKMGIEEGFNKSDGTGIEEDFDQADRYYATKCSGVNESDKSQELEADSSTSFMDQPDKTFNESQNIEKNDDVFDDHKKGNETSELAFHGNKEVVTAEVHEEPKEVRQSEIMQQRLMKLEIGAQLKKRKHKTIKVLDENAADIAVMSIPPTKKFRRRKSINLRKRKSRVNHVSIKEVVPSRKFSRKLGLYSGKQKHLHKTRTVRRAQENMPAKPVKAIEGSQKVCGARDRSQSESLEKGEQTGKEKKRQAFKIIDNNVYMCEYCKGKYKKTYIGAHLRKFCPVKIFGKLPRKKQKEKDLHKSANVDHVNKSDNPKLNFECDQTSEVRDVDEPRTTIRRKSDAGEAVKKGAELIPCPYCNKLYMKRCMYSHKSRHRKKMDKLLGSGK